MDHFPRPTGAKMKTSFSEPQHIKITFAVNCAQNKKYKMKYQKTAWRVTQTDVG